MFFRISLLIVCSLLSILTYAQKVNVRINTSEIRQPWEGYGFNHEGNKYVGTDYVINDEIQWMLDHQIRFFRDMLPLKGWEPENDNENAEEINWNGFNTDDQRIINVFKRLKTVKDHQGILILGIWDQADWNIANPTAKSQRRLENLDEFIESITAFLLHGREKYGLEVDYIDVNESSGGYSILLDAEEYGNLVVEATKMFRKHGLTTTWQLGSVHKPHELYYCQELYDQSKVREMAAEPSFHSYHAANAPDSIFLAWGKWRDRIDRNIWCTENDYNAFYWTIPDREEWRGVAETARVTWRVIQLAKASNALAWFNYMQYPYMHVHQSYLDHFKPGGKIVNSTSSDPDIMVVAYHHPQNNNLVLQVLNYSDQEKSLNITGLTSKQYQVWGITGADLHYKSRGNPEHREILKIKMPGQSFYTIFN